MANEVHGITAKSLTVALCAAGVIGGAVGAIAVNHENAVSAETVVRAAAPGTTVAPATTVAPGTQQAMALPDFTQIVAHNGKAVVNIRVVATAKGGAAMRTPSADDDQDDNDPFSEFFRRFQTP